MQTATIGSNEPRPQGPRRRSDPAANLRIGSSATATSSGRGSAPSPAGGSSARAPAGQAREVRARPTRGAPSGADPPRPASVEGRTSRSPRARSQSTAGESTDPSGSGCVPHPVPVAGRAPQSCTRFARTGLGGTGRTVRRRRPDREPAAPIDASASSTVSAERAGDRRQGLAELGELGPPRGHERRPTPGLG